MLIIVLILHLSIISSRRTETREILIRNERAVPFLVTSGSGFIAAVAVPNPIMRHLFLAFNFEAHFGLATNNTFSPTILQTRWEGKRSVKDEIKSNREFTRKNFYRAVQQHFSRFGYNGTACILKTICQTSRFSIHENNGLLGTLLHIAFTPTSSKDENISRIFYEAELNGRQGKCKQYNSWCPKSVLDLISK